MKYPYLPHMIVMDATSALSCKITVTLSVKLPLDHSRHVVFLLLFFCLISLFPYAPVQSTCCGVVFALNRTNDIYRQINADTSYSSQFVIMSSIPILLMYDA
jgi:hypothetical protein